MEKKSFNIISKFGLHAKPATSLVDEANKYDSDIFLSFEGIKINLKSIMGLMSLGVPSNSVVEIIVIGPDEQVAMKAIVNFFVSNDIAKSL